MRRAATWAIVILTRVLLLLYPPSFRIDVGRSLLSDVARRATDTPTWRLALWLPRLAASLFFNACAAWVSVVMRSGSWLDLKLALRMLVKHPGLTLVGGLGIAVAVAIAVGFFALLHPRFYPDIPLSEGDRLVALENWDRRTGREERRSLHDFDVWRTGMKTVQDMTAFRTVARNLIANDGSVDVVEVAEIMPSGFELARVPPILGRSLVTADAAPGAPPVIVIGFDVWRSRFDSDPDAIGQQVRLGGTAHTVVGVMPEGFAFPVNHGFWIPLIIGPAGYEPGEGPQVFVSGRLASGVDIDAAHAELTAIGERMAATFPETHGHLRPEVLPYTWQFFGGNRHSADALWPMTALVSLLLVVVCVNVAILIYARTAGRLGEIAVRTALGASRRRIVAQLFAESLALSAVSTGLGLLVVESALDWTRATVAGIGDATFWTSYALTGRAVIFGVGLALLSAVITGVVPALRATGGRAQAHLHLASRGAGLHMGRVWMTLIVVQVSFASAGLPIAVALGLSQVRDAFTVPVFRVEQTVFAHVRLDLESSAGADGRAGEKALPERFERFRAEISRRLDAEPELLDHAFMQDLPLQGRTEQVAIEDDAASRSGTTRTVVRATVDSGFFRALDIPVLAGRSFDTTDRGGDRSDVVVVDRAFAERVLGSQDVLGRRVRYEREVEEGSDVERWYQVVGLVESVEANPLRKGFVHPRVYHLMEEVEGNGSGLAVHVAGLEPPAVAERLRQMVADIDPRLQLQVLDVAGQYRILGTILGTAAVAIGIALLSVIFLAAAGVYALMAFTVMRRRREIAIRAALGAEPGSLLRGIFGQAMRQIAFGIAIGIGVALLVDIAEADEGGALGGRAVLFLSGTVLLMGAVGLFAALGPARRGLRIEAAEVLKSE